MTHRLACEAADLFAAAATFAWPLPIVPCAPSRPMPILMTHGRQDWFVPYLGGHIKNDPNFPIIESAHFGFEEWRTRNLCSGPSPDLTESVGPTAVCERYTNCGAGVQVGLCSVDTDPAVFRGHRPYPTYVLDGFNTSQHAWDFFSSFPLPTQQVPALSFPGGVLLVALLAVALALRYRRKLSGVSARGSEP
jgi:polyhydroxybutyrate depolymerase